MQNITYKHSSFEEKNIESNEETEKQLRIFKIHGNFLKGYQLTVIPDLWDQKVWGGFWKVGKKKKEKRKIKAVCNYLKNKQRFTMKCCMVGCA